MMGMVGPIIADWWMALLSASSMVAIVGIIAMPVFQRLSSESWRIRGWVTAIILFQGLMFVRVPIHLGWLESSSPAASSFAFNAHATEGPALRASRERIDGGKPISTFLAGRHDKSPSAASFIGSIPWLPPRSGRFEPFRYNETIHNRVRFRVPIVRR